MIDCHKWEELASLPIAGIECNPLDRRFVLLEIAKYSSCQEFFFANPGYDWIQEIKFCLDNKTVAMQPCKYKMVKDKKSCTSIIAEAEAENAVFIFEGFGEIDEQLGFELTNFFFENHQHRIILLDLKIDIPIELYSIVPILSFGIPNTKDIQTYINKRNSSMDIGRKTNEQSDLCQALFGLSIGEIELLLRKNQFNNTNKVDRINQYKTNKIVKQGLKIVPKPDVSGVGGLDELERDLEKIKVLFSPEAKERGLRPPKAGCLWGLPGTGKSLIAKTMSERLNATLVACEWNDLLDTSLSRSLANLQYVLDVVDRIGNCVFSFDEFEKAFAGWSSGQNGGVLAKMAGKLLTWMQDHESPVIMLATINRLDMLPPELIRRFSYIWFFDSHLHYGAMWEIFQLHLEKHFPGYHQKISDNSWRTLFINYRGCSPAEIAGAIDRTHHELFYARQHINLTVDSLIEKLIEERQKFEPAIFNRTTSNALAEILMQASFARPVRGEDKSRFAQTPRGLFDDKENKNRGSKDIDYDEYTKVFYEITQTQPNNEYSYLF